MPRTLTGAAIRRRMVSIAMPYPFYVALVEFAVLSGRSVSDIIREASEQYLYGRYKAFRTIYDRLIENQEDIKVEIDDAGVVRASAPSVGLDDSAPLDYQRNYELQTARMHRMKEEADKIAKSRDPQKRGWRVVHDEPKEQSGDSKNQDENKE